MAADAFECGAKGTAEDSFPSVGLSRPWTASSVRTRLPAGGAIRGRTPDGRQNGRARRSRFRRSQSAASWLVHEPIRSRFRAVSVPRFVPANLGRADYARCYTSEQRFTRLRLVPLTWPATGLSREDFRCAGMGLAFFAWPAKSETGPGRSRCAGSEALRRRCARPGS